MYNETVHKRRGIKKTTILKKTLTSLTASANIRVRFDEVDSLQIVWHGNYVKYFEDARAAFNRKYGLEYLNVYAKGYSTPIVNMNCDFKRFLKYDEEAIAHAWYVDHPGAKLILSYKIFSKNSEQLIAKGETTQVFLDHEMNLQLNQPDFYAEWRNKWL